MENRGLREAYHEQLVKVHGEEEGKKLAAETDKKANAITQRLNARYKDPERYLARKNNPSKKFGNNIFKKLKKKK